MASSVLLFFLSIILIYHPLTTADIYDSRCVGTAEYSANSALSANLDLTLSSLNSNAALGEGFYNTSIGQSPDRVSVNTPLVFGCDPNADVSDPDLFNATLMNLTSSLITRAVNGSSDNRFATGDESLNSSTRIYALVQCTPDISQSDCQLCLSRAVGEIGQLCDRKQGARILKPSCNIRFESSSFYDARPRATTTPPSPPAPTSPLPPIATNSNGRERGGLILERKCDASLVSVNW